MNQDKLNDWLKSRKNKANLYTKDALFHLIKNGDIGALARGITLIESANLEDKKQANELLRATLPFSGNSFRIGITGVPGVGKSTFIESFGSLLIEKGKKVAVLAIDPSSELNHGSILGDKTRMEKLASNELAFIRPTSSGNNLGGVARNTREAIILCELAGFDVIIIETVGVGQSETQVHSMVDFFLLLMLAGAGDELQGIKRGIMEMADLLVITKADGENKNQAKIARQTYQSALHLFPENDKNWYPKSLICSAFDRGDVGSIIEEMDIYFTKMTNSGFISKNRKKQDLFWFKESVNTSVLAHFYSNKEILITFENLKKEISLGKMTSFEAADVLFQNFITQNGK